jgi:hypothetical protein
MNSEFDNEAARPNEPRQPNSHTQPPAATCYETTPVSAVTYSYTYEIPDDPRHFSFAHDHARGLITLTTADGRTERFRDNPVRYLVVEPNPQTGELQPAAKHGRPVYVYLCREEREG